MAYSKMFAIKTGDRMVTYGGFSCIAAGTIVLIEEDAAGKFFRCSDGLHYLESQRDKDDTCLGLSVSAQL